MKRFLIPPLVVLVLSSASLVYLVWRVEPYGARYPNYEINYLPVTGFILATFFFLSSFVSLVLYLLYRATGDYRQARYSFRAGLRQGVLVGLGGVIGLILLLTRTANPLTIVLTLAVLISLEFSLREE